MYEVFQALLAAFGVDSATVCREIGVAQSTISNWKNRNNLISADIGLKVCEYFNITLDYLYTGSISDASGTLSRDETELISGFRVASGPVRRIMLDAARDALKGDTGKSSNLEEVG